MITGGTLAMGKPKKMRLVCKTDHYARSQEGSGYSLVLPPTHCVTLDESLDCLGPTFPSELDTRCIKFLLNLNYVFLSKKKKNQCMANGLTVVRHVYNKFLRGNYQKHKYMKTPVVLLDMH